jgi:hypothetical protein
MFKWLNRKKNDELKNKTSSEPQIEDAIEHALWEIKEEYDLETEEVAQTVLNKRKYVKYMNDRTKNNK